MLDEMPDEKCLEASKMFCSLMCFDTLRLGEERRSWGRGCDDGLMGIILLHGHLEEAASDASYRLVQR